MRLQNLGSIDLCQYNRYISKSAYEWVTRVRACSHSEILNCTKNGTLVMCMLIISNINILHSLCNVCYYF